MGCQQSVAKNEQEILSLGEAQLEEAKQMSGGILCNNILLMGQNIWMLKGRDVMWRALDRLKRCACAKLMQFNKVK